MEAKPPKDLEWSETRAGRESCATLRPSKLQGIPLLVGASLWDSFFVMLWMGLSRVHAPERAYVFPLVHAAVGVFVTWLALARILNVMRITVGPKGLLIEQSPIPRAALRVEPGELEGFETYVTPGSGEKRGVRVVRKGASPLKLPFPLDAEEDAAFVASRLNEALATVRGGSVLSGRL